MSEEEQYVEEGNPEAGISEEEYLDEEDLADQQDRLEDQQDEADITDTSWAADVPQGRRPEGLYQLFGKVLRAKDNSKLGNLDKYELGPQPFMNVRNAQFLALLGRTVRHERFARFFYDLAEITLKTSASKKGWFPELFVSQKKSTTRFSGSGFGGQPSQFGMQQQPAKKRRFNLFGGGQPEPMGSEQQ